MENITINTEEKLEIILKHLRKKKAENIEVVDVHKSKVTDYFVICSGTSNTHIKTIADGLLVDGKEDGLQKVHSEGYSQAKWILVDYGDIVVHIFAAEEREYYDLESLWKQTSVKLEGVTRE